MKKELQEKLDNRKNLSSLEMANLVEDLSSDLIADFGQVYCDKHLPDIVFAEVTEKEIGSDDFAALLGRYFDMLETTFIKAVEGLDVDKLTTKERLMLILDAVAALKYEDYV